MFVLSGSWCLVIFPAYMQTIKPEEFNVLEAYLFKNSTFFCQLILRKLKLRKHGNEFWHYKFQFKIKI